MYRNVHPYNAHHCLQLRTRLVQSFVLFTLSLLYYYIQHPVYCMSVVGTQNAHNLISVSTDGRLCSWSLDMLSQPQEKLELHRQQSKPVAVTCLAFPHSDVNNFVVGSEEGAAYSACRHGNRAGITDTYEAHQGPVTGISANAVQGGIDFSHLFLTSSIDWTIKLWSLKVTLFIMLIVDLLLCIDCILFSLYY